MADIMQVEHELNAPNQQNGLSQFLTFMNSHWIVGPVSLGYFAVLTEDLRKEIWSHIDQDITFARAMRVNREWKSKLEVAWIEFAKKRFSKDITFWLQHGSDWKWVVRCKTTTLTEEQCQAGIYTGPGTFQECNGVYEGEFKCGKKNGLGKKTFNDMSLYIGEWQDNTKSGQGSYTWHDGTSYVGGWKEDRYHGFGVKSWSDGDRYEGGWKDDRKHGNGTYTWSNGDKYMGLWEEDKQHGMGRFEWGTGVKYVGKYKDNMRNDTNAVLTWPNGDRYEGGFVNNMIQGKGTYSHASGDKYIGEWKGSQRHGRAVYIYGYGGKFEGYFQDDERNGPGVMTWPDGDRFEGVWKSGGRIGQGRFICSVTNQTVVQTWNEKPHRNYAEQIPKKFPRKSMDAQHNAACHPNATAATACATPTSMSPATSAAASPVLSFSAGVPDLDKSQLSTALTIASLQLNNGTNSATSSPSMKRTFNHRSRSRSPPSSSPSFSSESSSSDDSSSSFEDEDMSDDDDLDPTSEKSVLLGNKKKRRDAPPSEVHRFEIMDEEAAAVYRRSLTF